MASIWEEQHQAASVLLWDVQPVQTNLSRASSLMGTRPAQGPNPLFLHPSSSSLPPPPLSVPTHTPAEGRTSIIPNRPENIPLFLSPFFPHNNGSWRSTFLHQCWPSWPWSSQTPVTYTYLHRHTFSHFKILLLSLPLSSTFFLFMHHTQSFAWLIPWPFLFPISPYLYLFDKPCWNVLFLPQFHMTVRCIFHRNTSIIRSRKRS